MVCVSPLFVLDYPQHQGTIYQGFSAEKKDNLLKIKNILQYLV